MFFILKNKKYILLIFQNLNREKQVFLLMIPNVEGWHYIALTITCIIKRNNVKTPNDFSCLICLHSFRTENKLKSHKKLITSKHHCDFSCLNCLHSFRMENKLKSHKKVCENKDFCNIMMTSENSKTLEFILYQIS